MGAALPEAVQTMPRRLLGGELKRLRALAKRSAEEAAAVINKDRSRISRVEDGRSNLTAEELAALLDLYGVTKAERKKLLAMGVEARKRQPKQRAYVDTLPGSYHRISNLEAEASHIFGYEKGIFPGLLQCDVYAEALMAAGDDVWWESSYQERVDRVSFRLDRQRRVLQAEPAKQLEFIITDDALNTEFGGPQVLRRQLEHLLRLLDEHPNLDVRVLSATVADSPAPCGGFAVLRFPEPALPVGLVSVVFGPSPSLDEPADTAALDRAFTRLREMASGKAESRREIEQSLPRS
jgi:transcriptional regulator with XRE-family HTH domain